MSVFSKRWRGFRIINLAGLGLLITLVLGVYLAKTIAWRERNEIAAVELKIAEEKLRIRLLQAEVAHLEQPRRLQALSSGALGMAPIGPKQEIALSDLKKFARPAPEPADATVADAASPTAPLGVVPVAAQAAPAPAAQATEQ
jgi:hypothetical protein